MSKYLIKLGQNSKKAHKIIDTKIKNNVLKKNTPIQRKSWKIL